MFRPKKNLVKKFFRLFIFLVAFRASAALATTTTCPTWLDGQLCNGNGKSWCYQSDPDNACQVETPCTPVTNGTRTNNCQTNTCVVNCDEGYVPCDSFCQLPQAKPANCFSHNPCTGACTVCNTGYELSGSTCVTTTLKLGVKSVSGNNVIQAASDALLYVNSTGVGIGTNNPSTTLHVVGKATLSDDLVMTAGKSIKLDSTSDTILYIGNYSSGGFTFGSSSNPVASIYIEGDLRANRLCFKDDCKASWSEIQGITNYWTLSGTNIYNNNTGNVGIGTNSPQTKLHVVGTIRTNLTGTGNRCLYVTENGDISAK